MQAGFEPEPLRTEARFHADTVQKAVALAQRMEQERRSTLSLDDVKQLAGELNLDAQLLQQALARVSAEEAQRLAPPVVQHQMVEHRSRNRTATILLVIALALVLPLLLLLLSYSTVSVAPLAPPTAVISGAPEPVVPTAPPPPATPAPPSPDGVRPSPESGR